MTDDRAPASPDSRRPAARRACPRPRADRGTAELLAGLMAEPQFERTPARPEPRRRAGSSRARAWRSRPPRSFWWRCSRFATARATAAQGPPGRRSRSASRRHRRWCCSAPPAGGSSTRTRSHRREGELHVPPRSDRFASGQHRRSGPELARRGRSACGSRIAPRVPRSRRPRPCSAPPRACTSTRAARRDTATSPPCSATTAACSSSAPVRRTSTRSRLSSPR